MVDNDYYYDYYSEMDFPASNRLNTFEINLALS